MTRARPAFPHRLLHDRRGATAAEFAMVLPLLILLLLGMIDAGRLLYDLNRAKKVTQYGVRIAAVVNPVASAILTDSFIRPTATPPLTQGDTIPASAMRSVRCDTGSNPGGIAALECRYLTEAEEPGNTAKPALSGLTAEASAFREILFRMRRMTGQNETLAGMTPDAGYLTADNVVVTYRGSGLGYAGNPYGADISPLITVGLRGLQMNSVVTLGIVDLTLPDVESTLTAEDLSTHSFSSGTTGSQSN